MPDICAATPNSGGVERDRRPDRGRRAGPENGFITAVTLKDGRDDRAATSSSTAAASARCCSATSWASPIAAGALAAVRHALSRCRARGRANPTPYTRATAGDGGLALAHSAAAPDRQRPRVLAAHHRARARAGRAARRARRRRRRPSRACLRFDGRPAREVVGEELRRDRPVRRLHRAAGIHQHPSDPVGHLQADGAVSRPRLRSGARSTNTTRCWSRNTSASATSSSCTTGRPSATIPSSGTIAGHGDARDAAPSGSSCGWARARLFRNQRDLFTEDSWIAVLLGQARVPAVARSAGRRMLEVEESARFIASIRESIEKTALAMPTHEQFIAQHCAAAASATAA